MSAPVHPSPWFQHVLGHFPTGVVIVTAVCDGTPAGMSTVSFTSVSLDPPLIAILPARTSVSWLRIAAAGAFCVNILNARQEGLYRRFATREGDRFTGVSWRAAPSGAPVLAEALAWLDCSLEEVMEAGDHFIALGRITSMGVGDKQSDDRSAGPLVFFQGGYGTVDS